MITLLDTPITDAVSITAGNAFPLTHAKAVTIQANFVYGSGGTTAAFWVQMSLDGGATWVDVCNFAHTAASLRRAYNLSALTPVTTVYTATDGALADNTAKDGIIGGLIRVKYVTTGTYAATTIKITAVPK